MFLKRLTLAQRLLDPGDEVAACDLKDCVSVICLSDKSRHWIRINSFWSRMWGFGRE